MRTFYCKTKEHWGFHPIFELYNIENPEGCISPKIGDTISQWDIEALIYNGNMVILEPKNEQPKT